MLFQRRKTDIEPEVGDADSARFINSGFNTDLTALSVFDYFKFVLFCVLLIVPLYAIVKSAIKHDWMMMIIDALLVPVGFVHGLLMLFGFVN